MISGILFIQETSPKVALPSSHSKILTITFNCLNIKQTDSLKKKRKLSIKLKDYMSIKSGIVGRPIMRILIVTHRSKLNGIILQQMAGGITREIILSNREIILSNREIILSNSIILNNNNIITHNKISITNRLIRGLITLINKTITQDFMTLNITLVNNT